MSNKRVVVHPEAPPSARPRTEYVDLASHEKKIAESADYFTVFLYGVGKYDRVVGLEDAKDLAVRLRASVDPKDNPRDAMVYAVKGQHQVLVTSLGANGRWKDVKR